jgi:SAM-dependent methyltransferase
MLALPLERSRLALCGDCGHAVTESSPRRVSHRHYGSADGRAQYERDYLDARIAGWDAGLAALGEPDGRLLLDFGCGYGHFLAHASSRGWRVRGYEPGAELRRLALPAVAGSVHGSLDDVLADGPYDAVTLWDVLEHVDDVPRCLESLRGALAPAGLVAVRVPDARALAALERHPLRRPFTHAYLKACHPTNPEEHRNHFTPRSLAQIARGAGLVERARLDSARCERVMAGRTRVDAIGRRGLHRLGRDLPYEFTLVLAREDR